MRTGLATGLLGALALVGCATTAPAVPTGEVASVSVETGPCFGACPVFRVTVNADGRGVFEGRRFTAVEGERAIRVTPEQFRRLVAHLQPVRPASGSVRYSGEACEMMATDLPSTDVTWGTAGGEAQNLYFYHGCDMEKNRAIAERLDEVPRLLGIVDLVRRGE